MSDTIFDKIVRGEAKSWKIWEDESHLAFLTPFTANPGATVVIPKTNIGDNLFELNQDDYTSLMTAAKTVADKLEAGLGVDRIAMVVEGLEVSYIHIRLYPVGEHFGAYPDQGSVPDKEMDRLQQAVKAA